MDDAVEDVDSSNPVAWNHEEPADEAGKGDAFGEITEESGDSSQMLEGEGDGAVVKVAEINAEHVESVVSILKGAADVAVELSLDKQEQNLNEEIVVKVIEASDRVGANLIRFFKWAFENEELVKSSRAIEQLIQSSVGRVPEFSKKAAYMLWDLGLELGTAKWVLNTQIPNELIYTSWELGNAKAALKVLNKFNDFGCSPDAHSYYYTIQALGKRSMFDTEWIVCEKMINSWSLPGKDKIGEVIVVFCKGKKLKEAI